MAGQASIAKPFYEDLLINESPDRMLEVICRAKLVYYNIVEQIEAGQTDLVETEIEGIKTQFPEINENVLALHLIAEDLYTTAMEVKSEPNSIATEYFSRSIAIYENEILSLDNNDPNTPDVQTPPGSIFTDNFRALVWYMLGLDYWYLGQWFPAADGFEQSIIADPNHPFAGQTHWLVSSCYEKLKDSETVDTNEANIMIEWGYQTLFDEYPDCPIVDYAALRLGEINLARGKPVTACVYFNWYLDYAFEEDGRIAQVQRILAGMEGGCQ